MTDLMKLGLRARKLSKDYDLGTQIEEGDDTMEVNPSGIFLGDLGYVEHVIHELAHALCLNIPFGPNLSDQIGEALRHMTSSIDYERTMDHAVHQEAMVIGIETLCCEFLRLPLVTGDFTEMAAIQGASWQDVEMFRKLEWAMHFASVLADHMRDRPLTEEDTMPIHFAKLEPGTVVRALVNYGEGTYNIEKGMLGVVYKGIDYEHGYTARVRWLQQGDIYESDIFGGMYDWIS